MPLTKIECDRAACFPCKPYTLLSDEKGLYLEVTASGGRYWRMKYRHGGKEKRLALGGCPAVSLAQARNDQDKACEVLGVERGVPARLWLSQQAAYDKWQAHKTLNVTLWASVRC